MNPSSISSVPSDALAISCRTSLGDLQQLERHQSNMKQTKKEPHINEPAPTFLNSHCTSTIPLPGHDAR